MADHAAQGKVYYEEQKATGNYHESEKGFLYRFIHDGQTGKGESCNATAKPGPTDKVKVHYEGKLISGKVFDSSYKRGESIEFGLNQVISGWGAMCQLMSKGDKVEVILPQNLAYGARGAGADIPPYATLIFIIEYLPPSANEILGQKYYDEQKATGKWTEAPEGYLYQWLSAPPAADAPKPTARDTVSAHYAGTTIDGQEFDSSIKRGKPSEFPLDGVVSGWTHSVQLMAAGSKIKIILPSHLAYGDQSPTPKIPPGSTLIFEIELFSWKPSPPPQPQCPNM